MTQIINMAQIAESIDSTRSDICSNGDYMLRHITGEPGAHGQNVILPNVIKIDGLSIFMCSKGEAEMTINFRPLKLTAGSIMVLSPNDLLESVNTTSLNIEGYALFLSIEFLQQLSLDSNALDYRNISLDASPIIQLDDERLRLFNGYFNLLELNATVNREPSVYTRNISRSVVGAMIYQLLAFVRQKKDVIEQQNESTTGAGRRRYYVKDFMTLLQKDYKQHRTVGHYAEKLFISAKYLSLIIKESTGRTATEWIDHFVILEAKNLLRYSGRNIQQIAYDLNFHNQSAFGKYFKQLTGMSPSQFRKT